MEDLIRVHDRYYILATSGLSDDRTRVLKHADSFAVLDRYGDIQPIGLGQQGLFHDGTRHLSRLELRLAGTRPLLLDSTVQRDAPAFVGHLTNPDVRSGEHLLLPRNTIHVERTSVLWEGTAYTRLRVRNFELRSVELGLALVFEADFADIFEVRGIVRRARGRLLPPEVSADRVVLVYQGLDGVRRQTTVYFDPPPRELTGARADIPVHLAPTGETDVYVTVGCVVNGRPQATFAAAARAAGQAIQGLMADSATVRTSSQRFNEWLARSQADLAMMTTETPHGLYPYAGVPWFSTPFGRDGIITALETLWADPTIARGVLRFLAATQATEVRPEADAEPGKIVHEMRRGEMPALGEVPFARYYGSVDATPLYVVLADAYFARTGDLALVEELWPNVEAALGWIERAGDVDGDGFVEYARRSEHGLLHQGWKDSEDAVSHADGALAEGPIALCEVQAYVYGAKCGAARLAAARGDRARAEQLEREAQALRERFEEAFWSDELGTYALALDGRKRPCRVRSSNAGQCLLTGIASPARARTVAATLMHPDLFCGWGIRTLSARERRYNPMSYHNGSVWPHDNAVIAAGFSRYHLQQPAESILDGLFHAGVAMDLHRLPELFCGFARQAGVGPTLYPVACAPQAWAAGAVYLLLAATLGLSIDGVRERVHLARARLPAFLETVWIERLRVGTGSIDLELRRHREGVGINVLRRDGPVEVMALK